MRILKPNALARVSKNMKEELPTQFPFEILKRLMYIARNYAIYTPSGKNLVGRERKRYELKYRGINAQAFRQLDEKP